MTEILVDTDVVSYLLNRHSLAEIYEELLVGYTPLISFMTVAEMYRGAIKRDWGARRMAELKEHLHQFAVVPYTFQLCISYAEIVNDMDNRGKTIAVGDALIAASAISLGIGLITNNRRHFQGIPGLTVVSARQA